MQQRYHSNATTNIRLRSEINNSKKPNNALAIQYGISEKTVRKWKQRTVFNDKSSRPHSILYALSYLEQLIAINLRTLTWGGL